MQTRDHTIDDDFNGTVDANTVLGLQKDTQFDRIVKIVFYSALIILGVFGNLIIIVVIARYKHLRTKFNLYVVNLAVCDLLVAVTCPWVHLMTDLSPHWPLGEVICKVHTFVQVTMICSSIFTLCTLTLDRYMAITSPGCLWITQKYQPLTIVIIWVCSLGVAVPWLIFQIYNEFDWIGGHEVVCQVAFPSLAHRRTYYVCFFVLVFLVPVLLMLALLVAAIIRTGYARPDGSLTTEEFKRSQRMAQYFLFTVIVLFCVCWAPQQALLLWDVYRDIHVKPPGLRSVHFAALYVAYSSSAINPIIYFLFSKCFRETVKGCCSRRRQILQVAVEPLQGPSVPLDESSEHDGER
ncbi:QRFP-like peptide receptor [Dreissena polymorpha]|uniref:G-protein coupled receptors family 1 profile domain-containing protein n=1 Tax=Dreissena polymorpha TaxID=45954 RepID=A0A9D4LNJ1_DREPO|nr:QRFP-like peptide receptor [Dreissena polymorpha]XP_052261873.1 QRFP-like peptide receptor [Dreissena polymorpha]XP_052261874.1 QRFP-like peptide receptor [Dreissena polymorpha]XP_052261875.1 QRFP-like peptide receptor [Dreissena polymorpha]XP_052261876.1 QRFP-like peptide receptor [Dreissena polymorpha]KAH3861201.1 hypothetical protein DPMN_024128 [Dreissena polymorpha]